MSGKRVIIVGGGFGGLHVARRLKRSLMDVKLIDRRNFHLFQPLLYQVATGGLSPANIAAPIRFILRRHKNIQVVLGNVTAIRPQRQTIDVTAVSAVTHETTTRQLGYDHLVLATGVHTNYFGHDDWVQLAPGLKTVEDATAIRARIFSAFEMAELERDPVQRRKLMTFVVVGGGPTGVELAGAIAELARKTLPSDFRSIQPQEAKIILLDAGPQILASFPPELAEKALASLTRLGVKVATSAMVSNVLPDEVHLTRDGVPQSIATGTVLWAAGVGGGKLAQQVAAATGAPTDRSGRIYVNQDLSIPDHPNIFVIGDIAHCQDNSGKPLPGVAPVAIQQGKFVANLINARIHERPFDDVFKYRDKGNLATIGRSAAIADLKRIQFNGFPAWFLWAFVHIMSIILLQNRVLILFQWAWNYFTLNKSARLITEVTSDEQDPLPGLANTRD